jgi:hypothetical protein
MSGEVSVSNRSLNIWTLERVLQVHEASSTSKPTVWDHFAIAPGTTARLDVRDTGTYVFKVLDMNQVSVSTITVTQPEGGEAHLTLTRDQPSSVSPTVQPALSLESGSRIAITEPTQQGGGSRPWTPLPPPPALPSLPNPPIEPKGSTPALPSTTPLETDNLDLPADAAIEPGQSPGEGGGGSRGRRTLPTSASAPSGTATSHFISFPFSHAEEGEHGNPATLVVLAGTELIGQCRCEVQRSEIAVRDRNHEASFDAEGRLKLQQEFGSAPAFPIVLRARIHARPIGYFTVMESKQKGQYVKLQSETARTKANSQAGIEHASNLKIGYELQVPIRYVDRAITIEYRTPHKNNGQQMGWRLALGAPGGWVPILSPEHGAPLSPAPAMPPPSLLSSVPPPSSSSSSSSSSSRPSRHSARPSSTPIPEAPASSPVNGAPRSVPAAMPGKPPLVRSLRYIRHVPVMGAPPLEDAVVIETKNVINLFQKDQVLIVDLGNENFEGFAGHMETMLFAWDRVMENVKDREKKHGGSLYESWRQAWHSHVRAVLPPDTRVPLPSPRRVRRDDVENMTLAEAGLMGYTVVWSSTYSHVIIGKISEQKQFEEKAWWKEHDGKPLTLEIAHDLLRRYVFEPQPGRGRWVSFMPVPARFRTQLVDHYDAMTADDNLL